jgi:hypothetical protein
MIAVETKKQAPNKARSSPALEIRFHFVDGSREVFTQSDPNAAEALPRRINLPNLFNQSRIVVADDYSKSVFICSQINRIDLISKRSDFGRIPEDHTELVELTKSQFRKHVPLDEPSRLEKRDQARGVGDLLVSFLHLRMRGGEHVYLMNETLVKLPIENHSFMQRLLSKGTYSVRLSEGGQGFLNLQNLIGYTVYPGVPELPVDTWMAQPKRTQ